MSPQRSARCRIGVASVAALVAGLGVAEARAADEDEVCVGAHLEAQRHRRANELLRTREALKVCARTSCPSRVAADCTNWLDQLQVPSVILAVRGPDGKDAIAVRVSLDGHPLTERLDARPVEVDPGPHSFRFEIPGHAPIEEEVLIREGERGRRVSVEFPRTQPAPDAPATRPTATGPIVPTTTWVLAGVGIVGFAGFAVFGTMGRVGQDHLDDQQCAPYCRGVDDVRRNYLIGDVSLAVGIVATGAALVTFLLHTQEPQPRAVTVQQPTRATRPRPWSIRF
jgi:hypothetical protein